MEEIKLRGSDMYAYGVLEHYADGTKELNRTPITYKASVSDNYHLVKEGERLDQIAYKYYSDYVEDASKYWWLLADVNNIENPLDTTEFEGKIILVPNFLKVKLQL